MIFRAPRIGSTTATLGKMLTQQQLSEILETTPDRRRIFERAAPLVGLSERDLLHRIAERLELPFTEEVLPTDCAPPPPFPSLLELRRAGAFPLMEDQSVIGVACIEPRFLHETWRKLLPIVIISTWPAIVGAHEKTLESLADTNTAAAQRALDLVVAEGRRYGVAEIVLTPCGRTSGWEYRMQIGGKTGRGTIASHATRGLPSLLSSSDLPFEVVRLNDTTYRLVLSRAPQDIPERTVVVVDDNATFARVTAKYLERHGFTVVHYDDPLVVLEDLAKGTIVPAAIVSDVHMPHLTGSELLARVRRQRTIPFIVLSSDDSPETRIALLSRGADAYLSKAQDPTHLCTEIDRLIRSYTA
jgi:two-component system, chemotaxis family, chemotaxis protein CheY